MQCIIKRTATYGKKQSLYFQGFVTNSCCSWTPRKEEAEVFENSELAERQMLEHMCFNDNKYAKHTIVQI